MAAIALARSAAALRTAPPALRAAARGVASKRQIKRANFLRRRGAKPDPATSPAAVAAAAAAADLEWNTVVRDVAELQNGWTPPPEESPAHLPFAVRRTASGFLPVYPKVGANRPPATVLRGASGDLDALIAGLAGVAPGAEVTKRLGALEVRGDHVRGVRRWLAGLGL